MSLMSGLWLGASGIQTSQNALNTVAHNLSNLDTEGYTRQQVAQSDKTYMKVSTSSPSSNGQVGLGVYYSEVRRVRNSFLDASYREESGRFSFFETSYASFMEVEDILGELDGAAFNESLDDLWEAFQEIAKAPDDSTKISNLVQAGYDFALNANAVYKSFIKYQDNLNTQVKDMVSAINEIGRNIQKLNEQITKVEAGGLENANDLRDKRDLLIDELSNYVNITVSEDANSVVTVKVNGTNFVVGDSFYEMMLYEDKETGYVTPYWKQNLTYSVDSTGERITNYDEAFVYDLTREISTAAGTDVGSLRATLLARGNHHSNYTDLDTSKCSEQKLKDLKITEKEYDSDAGKEYYDKYISQSIIMNAEAEFDQLVHQVVTVINNMIIDNCDPSTGYLTNDDGTPILLFENKSNSGFKMIGQGDLIEDPSLIDWENDKYVKIYDQDGNFTNSYWLLVEEDPDKLETLFNSTNIEINQDLRQTPSLLNLTKSNDSVDYNLAKSFIEKFDEEQLFLNPNATKSSNIQDYYTDFITQIANSGGVYKSLYTNQQITLEQVTYERSALTDVSSDEELEHMIQFQNAYNAASRYINVLTVMLDSLINMAA